MNRYLHESSSALLHPQSRSVTGAAFEADCQIKRQLLMLITSPGICGLLNQGQHTHGHAVQGRLREQQPDHAFAARGGLWHGRRAYYCQTQCQKTSHLQSQQIRPGIRQDVRAQGGWGVCVCRPTSTRSQTATMQIWHCDIAPPKGFWQGKLKTVESSLTDPP